MITIKRAYEPQARSDNTRILVDRLWQRGIRKEEARVEKWMRDRGPSNELRRSFGHNPKRWDDFRKRYLTELKRPEVQLLLDETRANSAQTSVDPGLQRERRGT
jgi:uncharacterized protein YeaO (DUF488 family)